MKTFLKSYWLVLALVLLSFLTTWPLIRGGYFSHQDDLQVMRVFEMRKCLTDFQIPCRWVPDMGYGNGFPLFNYYSVLPYYIGAIFSFLIGFIGAAKVLFFIPLFFGPLFIYVLVKDLFSELPAFVSGVLFMFAPYRAVDSFVRGDVTESWAIALVPLVFYFCLKVIKSGGLKNILLLGLTLAAFLLCHNIMAIFFLPILIVWAIIWLIFEKSKILSLLGGAILGFGLSAFFLLPAYFEKTLVQIDNLTKLELNFRANFASIKDLFFNRNFGYGAVNSTDHLSYQIGLPYWPIIILLIGVFLLSFIKSGIINRLSKKDKILMIFFIAIFLIGTFMCLPRSAPIWEKLTILRFAQFPWRFLSVVIFSTSILGGIFTFLFKDKLKWWVAGIVIVLTIALNFDYFKPQTFYPNLTDNQKLSGSLWEDQKKAAVLDYLPVGAQQPRENAPALPIINGAGQASFYIVHSNYWSFNLNLKEPSEVIIPIFNFPTWQIKQNGQVISYSKDDIGRIEFNLPEGNYQINGSLYNTPIRAVSNFVSLLSIVITLALIIYGKFRKVF